jgi:pimeloyl-ACP methyl ester carboxylesterase
VRVVRPHLPDRSGRTDGLAWTMFEPRDGGAGGTPSGGVVVLHGAGSRKESHHDYARVCASLGLAALCFDARGHGESEGALGAGALADVATMAGVVREALGGDGVPVGLRGSSMGGYLALVAAREARAAAVVAICPAPAAGLRRGLDDGRFDFRADDAGLREVLADHDAVAAAAGLDVPLMLLHARGDEQVPVEHSREIAAAAPDCRFVEVPGGHHRSIQHDAELQGETARFLVRALRRRRG